MHALAAGLTGQPAGAGSPSARMLGAGGTSVALAVLVLAAESRRPVEVARAAVRREPAPAAASVADGLPRVLPTAGLAGRVRRTGSGRTASAAAGGLRDQAADLAEAAERWAAYVRSPDTSPRCPTSATLVTARRPSRPRRPPAKRGERQAAPVRGGRATARPTTRPPSGGPSTASRGRGAWSTSPTATTASRACCSSTAAAPWCAARAGRAPGCSSPRPWTSRWGPAWRARSPAGNGRVGCCGSRPRSRQSYAPVAGGRPIARTSGRGHPGLGPRGLAGGCRPWPG